MDAANDRLGRFLAAWVRGCARAWPLVLLVAALLCAGSLVASKHRLGINSNFDEMLDPDLPFRRAQEAFIEAFPQYEANLVLVVDADTPEDARAAATSFAAALAERPELFRYVHVPMAEPFLEGHAFYYLDEEELDDLALRLAEIQPFLGRLTRDPSLRGLFDMLGYALDEQAKGGEFDATPLLKRLRAAIDGVVRGEPTRLSWQELMQDEDETPSVADRRQIVLAQAVRDYGAFQPAGGALAAAREIFAALPRDGHARLRITGGLAMEHEELTTVRQGAEWIGLLTMVLVGLVLAVGLRSVRLVVTSLVALVVGLLLTTAFAALAVGHLNPISVAFGVLYIGLGVDYAIHLTLRYREGIEAGRSHLDALGDAAGDVGSSLVLCTLTTAIGFYAFVPTAYRGVSELGLISGTGMFIGLFVSLTVLPALLSVVPYRRPPRTQLIRHGLLFRLLTDLPVRHRSLVLAVCTCLAVLGLALLPFVHFDLNPLNLRDPQTESVATFRDLLATSDVPPWSITLLAEDEPGADALAGALAGVPSVDKVIRLESYVPQDQEPKAIQLEDLALTLGGGFRLSSRVPPPSVVEAWEALRTMRADLERYRQSPAGLDDDTAAALDAALGDLDAHLATHDAATTFDALETSLLATLPVNLARLDEAVGAAPFGVEDLPADLQARWRAPDGRRRVEVFPRDSVEDVASLRGVRARRGAGDPGRRRAAGGHRRVRYRDRQLLPASTAPVSPRGGRRALRHPAPTPGRAARPRAAGLRWSPHGSLHRPLRHSVQLRERHRVAAALRHRRGQRDSRGASVAERAAGLRPRESHAHQHRPRGRLQCPHDRVFLRQSGVFRPPRHGQHGPRAGGGRPAHAGRDRGPAAGPSARPRGSRDRRMTPARVCSLRGPRAVARPGGLRMRWPRFAVVLVLVLALVTTPACVQFNRTMFELNQHIAVVAQPVVQILLIVPTPVRQGFRNFLRNLRYGDVVVNQWLQGKPHLVRDDLKRWVINSTLGVAGIFDPATGFGLPAHDEDFGQTLAVWGFPEGAYIVLPLIGPTTVRDGVGFGISFVTDPNFWVNEPIVNNTLRILSYVNQIEEAGSGIDKLASEAADPYTFAKEAYRQRRLFLIYDGKPPTQAIEGLDALDDMDDMDDEEVPGEDDSPEDDGLGGLPGLDDVGASAVDSPMDLPGLEALEPRASSEVPAESGGLDALDALPGLGD